MDQPAQQHRNPRPGGIDVVEPTLQGRSGGMKNVLQVQLFCQLASSLVDLSLVNDFTEITTGWAGSDESRQNGGVVARNCDRLWNVAVRGTEIYRTSADGLTALQNNTLQTGPLPAGAVRSDNLRAYRARIKVTSSSGLAVFDADCNQDMEFWGQQIEVTLLGPTNAVSVGSNDPHTATRSQFVVDSLAGCAVYPIEQTKNCGEFTLTEFLRSPANTASVIRVPRAAKSLKIYQGTPAAAAPSLIWTRQLGDPNTVTSIPVGNINFAARESTDSSAPVGNETHLQTDVEPANPRLFVLKWTIRP